MSQLSVDALLLSLNDIVVDVSHSCRQVVRKTVQVYLEQAIGLSPSDEPLLTMAEVVMLQKVGNFTSYHDLATAFVIYFIELLPSVQVLTFPSKFHVPALMAYLQMAGGLLQVGVDQLRVRKDISHLARTTSAAGGGVNGTHAALTKVNRHLLLSSGSVTRTNLVGRIYQELYLGADLFERTYGQPAVLVHTTGYLEHETLLIDLSLLEALSQKMPLGIIANCSRVEADYSIRNQHLEAYFQAMVTMDDVMEAKAKPLPNPWFLLEAASRLQPTPASSAYIGSNLGEVQAAKAANRVVPFTAIGSLAGAHDKVTMRRSFESNRADFIVNHPNELRDLLL